MGKVIQFPQNRRLETTVQRLKKVSDEFDSVIIQALENEGVEAHEIAGILAHRLGSLMKNMDEKSKLWDVCQRVLKKQADII